MYKTAGSKWLKICFYGLRFKNLDMKNLSLAWQAFELMGFSLAVKK